MPALFLQARLFKDNFSLKCMMSVLALTICTSTFSATAVISNERSGNLLYMDLAGKTTDIIELCARPRGMAQRETPALLYVACSDDGKVIEFDVTAKEPRRSFSNIPGAMSLALHEPSNRLIISNEGFATATVLDMSTGDKLATLTTGGEPDGVAITDDGKLIFVASENAGLVHVFDGETYQPMTNLLTHLRPRRMALRANELWVSSEMGSRVEIFSTTDFKKLDEIIFTPRGFRPEQLTPVDILFDPSEKTGFVALGSANNVVILDAVNRTIEKYILVGRRPWGLGLSPDSKILYVLNGLSDDVTLINLDKLRPIRTSRTGLVPHAVEIFR